MAEKTETTGRSDGMMKITYRNPLLAMALLPAAILSLSLGCSEERRPPTLPGTHPASWMEPSSADFHGTVVLTSGISSCRVCHGSDLRGGKVGVGCDKCHGPGKGTTCLRCHGGTDNNTGAPPKSLRGYTSTDSLPVGAHTMHLSLSAIADSFSCSVCHVVPMYTWDSAHLDFNTVTGQGTPDSVAEVIFHGLAVAAGATWSHTNATCRLTYCHGNFVGGETANAPIWNAQGQAACGSCHDVGAHPVNLKGLHPLHAAGLGLKCADCHANVVDTSLGVVTPQLHVNGRLDTLVADNSKCLVCHAPGTAACTFCHGGTDNQTGAPPKGLRGEIAASTLAVGAHTVHLEGGAIAGPQQCGDCHLIYTSVVDSGHYDIDSVAEVVWGGYANRNGGANWNRDTRTCGSTYCHGNFVGGKVADSPDWTASAQADCGSCHDVGSNPSELQGIHGLHITSYGLICNDCHANVVDAGNAVIDRSLHVNGTVDTMTANPATCANCHAPAPASCTYCHGGNDNLTGAPPKGLRGETATTTIAVGAHTKHMGGSALAGPLRCNDCHLAYTLVTDSGHFATDSIAEVVWGNFANRNGGAVWNRSTKLCTNTYCHGNFAGGISANAPLWTSASQAACGSCHDVGIQPSLLLGRHSKHAGEGVACYKCHFATLNSSDQISDPNAHVNGVFNVQFWTGTGSWNATSKSCSPPSGSGCHGSENWYQ